MVLSAWRESVPEIGKRIEGNRYDGELRQVAQTSSKPRAFVPGQLSHSFFFCPLQIDIGGRTTRMSEQGLRGLAVTLK